MIKINCLSNETFEALKRTFKSVTPVVNFESAGHDGCVDVFINTEALLMCTRDEVTIYYKGQLFRMSTYNFMTIKIE